MGINLDGVTKVSLRDMRGMPPLPAHLKTEARIMLVRDRGDVYLLGYAPLEVLPWSFRLVGKTAPVIYAATSFEKCITTAVASPENVVLAGETYADFRAVVAQAYDAHPDLEVERLPTISTSHLRQREAQIDWAKSSDGVPALNSEYGMMVLVSDFLDRDSLVRSAPTYTSYRDVAMWARKRGFRWVRFDCDAPTVNGLRTYDW